MTTFRYLHGDHLGSVAATSTSNTSPTVAKQYFTPWGEARFGSITTTDRNYTGQRKDDTGLLFYNARYYDPKLSRFLSADSIVPGMASGKGGTGSIGVDGDTKSMLTVDFHEGQFALAAGAENTFTRENGFNFESSEEGKYQWGPPNPQALNRYAYVLNNPLRYSDPTGHQCYDGVHRRGCTSGSNGSGRGGSRPGSAKGRPTSRPGGGGRSSGGGSSGFGSGARAAENAKLRELGLENVKLAGSSYNSGRKQLEAAGFKHTRTTSSGRQEFVHPETGATVSYDPGKGGGKAHWHIQDNAGNKYDRNGKKVDPNSGAAHIPAGP